MDVKQDKSQERLRRKDYVHYIFTDDKLTFWVFTKRSIDDRVHFLVITLGWPRHYASLDTCPIP